MRCRPFASEVELRLLVYCVFPKRCLRPRSTCMVHTRNSIAANIANPRGQIMIGQRVYEVAVPAIEQKRSAAIALRSPASSRKARRPRTAAKIKLAAATKPNIRGIIIQFSLTAARSDCHDKMVPRHPEQWHPTRRTWPTDDRSKRQLGAGGALSGRSGRGLLPFCARELFAVAFFEDLVAGLAT